MRFSPSLFPFVASSVTAFSLVAAILLLPDFARAGDGVKAAPDKGCSCPSAGPSDAPSTAPSAHPAPAKSKPKLARLAPRLDAADQIAALESVQLALAQVADGSSYVWHRSHGMLSGIVRPTASFKDARGQVCRHIVVVLNSLDTTKRTEAIACRMADGVWQLDG